MIIGRYVDLFGGHGGDGSRILGNDASGRVFEVIGLGVEMEALFGHLVFAVAALAVRLGVIFASGLGVTFFFKVGVVDHARVERNGTTRDESGGENDDREDGEVDTTDVLERVLGGGDGGGAGEAGESTIDDAAEHSGEDGVDDDVHRVQERHDRSERRDIAVEIGHACQCGLDVSRERDVTGGPTEADRQEDGSQAPGPDDLVALDGEEGKHPDEVERNGVQAQPGKRRLDGVGEEQDGERT